MNAGIDAILTGWQTAQQAFWQGAASKPAFVDARAFAPPDWQAFDGFVATLSEQVLPNAKACDLGRAQRAGAAWRDVISSAWARIQADFDAQRRAIWDPDAPPDWRLLRDRWLATAEAEFIRTQRSAEFLSAQSELLGATVDLMANIPFEVRASMARARRAIGDAGVALGELGLDGVHIATTPKHVIWRDGPATLSRYEPLDGRTPTLGPVVICYGLIGRQTMIDLTSTRSAVRQLLAAGVDVYVLDWGSPGAEEVETGFARIVEQRLPAALVAACAEAGTEQAVLFGICQGGTLAACLAATDPSRLAGLILAVTPIDFHADEHDADPAHGLANIWLRALKTDDLTRLVELEGCLSGALLGSVFNQLNPVRTLSKYAVAMPELAGNPDGFQTFMAMEKWLADRPDLPAKLAVEWLIDLYQNNSLVAGRFSVGGDPVSLRNIARPVLNIFATGDHIVPPPCSRALSRHLPDTTAYRELALPTGHIGAFVSERAQTLLVPEIVRWLREIDLGPGR